MTPQGVFFLLFTPLSFPKHGLCQQLLDVVLKKRQATLKRDISLMDDILADGHISEANLRLLVEKIYITEQDGKLNVDIHLKAPFRTHGHTYEDGEIAEAWSALDYDYDRLGAILAEEFWEEGA